MSNFNVQYVYFNGDLFTDTILAFSAEQAKNRLLLAVVSSKIIKIIKV